MAEYTDKNEDAQTVIDALKKAVFRGRIRLTEFFSDFDPLRTGYMSSAKFRTALMASGAMPLNERQMQVLTLRYIDPTDDQRVRYLELLHEIETVFTTANMQYDPHSTAGDFTPNLIEPGTVLPPAHEEAVGCRHSGSCAGVRGMTRRRRRSSACRWTRWSPCS